MTGSPATEEKRILMVAYHFPPASGSSGHLRTLSFVRELPRHGWQPIVLTAAKIAYPSTTESSLAEIPAGISVHRAWALDAARHLAIRGRYLRRAALPDRWANWVLAGVPTGLALIVRYRPRVIWTTYPIATAHLIGLVLHKLTGIPWIADFRDPMIEVDPYTGERAPSDPDLWKVRSWIESRVIRNSSRSVFVTSGARRICRENYPDMPLEKMALVPNGYDESSFVEAEKRFTAVNEKKSGPAVLLHSGLLYPTPDRDPKDFFQALVMLKQERVISPQSLRVVLRASGYEERYRVEIQRLGLEEIVHLEPSIPYAEALSEMLLADGLLLFQGYTSNPAIPAKLYEYLRARRPIFALVHEDGDTAATLRSEGVGSIVPLNSPHQIATGLKQFLEDVRECVAPVASFEALRKHSRETHAAEMARLLEDVVPK